MGRRKKARKAAAKLARSKRLAKIRVTAQRVLLERMENLAAVEVIMSLLRLGK